MANALFEANKAAGPAIINFTMMIPLFLIVAFAGLNLYMRGRKKPEILVLLPLVIKFVFSSIFISYIQILIRHMNPRSSRRKLIKNMIAGSAVLATGSQLLSSYTPIPKRKKFKLKEILIIPFVAGVMIPFPGVILPVGKRNRHSCHRPGAPKDWPMLQKYGLYSSMCYVAGDVSLTDGFAEPNFTKN